MAFVPEGSPRAKRERRMWFVVHEHNLLVRREADRVAVLKGAPRGFAERGTERSGVPLTDTEIGQLGIEPAAAHHLGELDGADAVAASFIGPPAAPFEPIGLRALARMLDPELFGVAGRALHVIDWATTSRFCGRCGTATVKSASERCMKCPNCGLEMYPRIAPAIIVLVRRGDQALLARNSRFPGAFFSTLAGFSEIGESLEETLAREVHEEVGVRVKDVRYFGSQPWPFPHSLMIGFTAEWAGGDIVVDTAEIAEARWFTADALPEIPPSLSIARRLIDAWIADVRR